MTTAEGLGCGGWWDTSLQLDDRGLKFPEFSKAGIGGCRSQATLKWGSLASNRM